MKKYLVIPLIESRVVRDFWQVRDCIFVAEDIDGLVEQINEKMGADTYRIFEITGMTAGEGQIITIKVDTRVSYEKYEPRP